MMDRCGNVSMKLGEGVLLSERRARVNKNYTQSEGFILIAAASACHNSSTNKYNLSGRY